MMTLFPSSSPGYSSQSKIGTGFGTICLKVSHACILCCLTSEEKHDSSYKFWYDDAKSLALYIALSPGVFGFLFQGQTPLFPRIFGHEAAGYALNPLTFTCWYQILTIPISACFFFPLLLYK